MEFWSLSTADDGVVTAEFFNPPSGYCTDAAVKELESLVLGWSGDPIAGLILAGRGEGSYIRHSSRDENRAGMGGW